MDVKDFQELEPEMPQTSGDVRQIEGIVGDDLMPPANGNLYYFVTFTEGLGGSAWVQCNKELTNGQRIKGSLTLMNPSVGEFHQLEVAE